MYTHHKIDHEFEGNALPRTCYIVCTVPRSGSSLLCEGLCLTGLAGAPTEFFDRNTLLSFWERWRVKTFDDYLGALLKKKTGPNGVFGCKVHYPQYEDFLEDRDFSALFPNLKYIYVRRRDRVAQAVSYSRAIRSGQWSSDQAPINPRPRFDFDHVNSMLEAIRSDERRWEALFEKKGIEPYRIDYENLAAAYAGTVREVLDFLGIEASREIRVPQPTLRRQADRQSEKWIQRYRRIQIKGRAFFSSPFLTRLRLRINRAGNRIRFRLNPSQQSGAGFLNGFIEGMKELDDGLYILGWLLLEDGPPDRITITDRSGVEIDAERIKRPDLKKAFPNIPGAGRGGYAATLPARMIDWEKGDEFVIRAMVGSRTLFKCRVVLGKGPRDFSRHGPPRWLGEGMLRI
jgi:LPS sulfotransferase NodH